MSDYSQFDCLGGVHPFAGINYTWKVWQKGDDIPVFDTTLSTIVGIDSETELIKNKHSLPPGVLAGFCSGDRCYLVWYEDWDYFIPRFLASNPTVKLGFANIGFDIPVLGEMHLVPELNKDNRCIELFCNYFIYKVSTVGWFSSGVNLDKITQETLGVALDKDESIRLTYHRNMQVSYKHCVYLVEDCASTERNCLAYNDQPTETIQARASFVLSQISRNGLLVDREFLEKKRATLIEHLEDCRKKLKLYGFKVKDGIDKRKTKDNLVEFCKGFDIDVEPILVKLKVKAVGAKCWKYLFAILYNAMNSGMLFSDIQRCMKDFLYIVFDGINKDKYADVFENLQNLLQDAMEDLESIEMIQGLGDAKPSGSSKPWVVLSFILLRGFSCGKHLKMFDSVKEELKEEIEQNLAWLSNSPVQLSATKMLQNHVKDLMSKHEGFQLVYTDGSKDKIREALTEEAKIAKKEGRKPNKIDISHLEDYKVTKDDAWRFEDANIKDPFLDLYFDFKHTEKLLSTFLTDKYIDTDGRVHTRFGFTVTARTSSISPNVFRISI